MGSLTKSFNPTGSTLAHLRRLATRPLTRQLPKITPAYRHYCLNEAAHTTTSASRLQSSSRPTLHRCALHKQTARPRRAYSTIKNPDDPSHNSMLSVSQRFRQLSREYGWSAMGVYLALSALDFPFCFAAVRWLGPDRVGRAEKAVLGRINELIPQPIKDGWRQAKAKIKELTQDSTKTNTAGGSSTIQVAEIVDDYDHGVADAEIRSQGANASIWTQLALAYAIHKSFIFIRLPITVAILPKVVKTLRGWGWQIGKRKPKSVQVP